MKKLLFLTFVFFSLSSVALAQSDDSFDDEYEDGEFVEEETDAEFPYSKIVYSDFNELINQKFKYDKKRNQLTLNHVNGWNGMANVFSSVDKPSSKDYFILIQYGKGNKIASVEVTFFDKKRYKSIINFAKDNGSNVKKSKSGGNNRTSFEFNGMKMSLVDEYVKQAVVKKVKDKETQEKVEKSEDRSFNKYVYTIDTGVTPSSQLLDKKAGKKKTKKSKGADNLF